MLEPYNISAGSKFSTNFDVNSEMGASTCSEPPNTAVYSSMIVNKAQQATEFADVERNENPFEHVERANGWKWLHLS